MRECGRSVRRKRERAELRVTGRVVPAMLDWPLAAAYASAMAICSACGHENSEGARFCNACASALASESAPGREERKVVTVLFADLVGFTARSEQLDPEDVEAILRPYHERLRSELERFGGTVEKFIGDAVMALFGAPLAHEDDPERAVRAALAIRDWAREDGELRVRIAVNTGEALINLAARPSAGEGMAAGDVVNTTARLQAAAPVDGVLVGETTYRATRHAIDYREHEPVEAKGKVEPIPVWEAVEAHSRLGVDLLRRVHAPLVGRERERTLLRETLVRVREERSPQLVTLVGVPGIGKSRLIYELLDTVEHGGVLTYWRQGRSLPYGEGVTYWALSEMVKAQAGVHETDSTQEVEGMLKAAVAGLITDATDAEWVASQLRPLAGVSANAEISGDRRSEAFTAWRRFFEAMAAQRPLVLVFEDIHWADDGLLDFVDHLVDWASGVPILVACTARPELLERRPGWGGGKLNATTLSLSPLSDAETAQLLAALLDQPLLEASTQKRLLAHAGGNPLYAEQYAQMHAEGRNGGELPVPESVQGIIAARLDLLQHEEKQLLQDASVLGKVFWLGGLADRRTRAAAEQHLHALERKGFVQRARQSSVADEAEYAFGHVLVRDVAYGQIPRAARAEKHRRSAEWIESLGRPEDHAEMLAHHYLSALELSRAAGESTRDIEERGRQALEGAGERALALNAYPAAARFYETALELWPIDSHERARLRFRAGRSRYLARQGGQEALEDAARALAELGERETAAEAEVTLWELILRSGQRDLGDTHLERAQELLAEAPPSRSKTLVLVYTALSHMLAGRHESAVEAGRQALALAEHLGIDELRAAALNFIGVARTELGDRGGLDDINRAAAIAVDASSPYELARASNNLAAQYFAMGELATAAEAAEECIRVSERFGQAVWREWQRPFEAGYAYSRGEWDRALQIADDFLVEAEAGGHYEAGGVLATRACIRLARGDTTGAAADAERAVMLIRPSKDPQAVYGTLSLSAYVAHATGARETAVALANEVIAALGEGISFGGSLSGLPYLAWTLSALGRSDELVAATAYPRQSKWVDAARAFATGDFRLSAEICAEMGAKPEEAYARLRMAESLAAEGRRAEADEHLRAALTFYRSVSATHYISKGETLLAASA
jgi:class 3 adenylate cyclase/tetratricopeptide (TPR) repeat protein